MAQSENDAMGNPPMKEWIKNYPSIKLGTFAESAVFGEIVIIATFGNYVNNTLDLSGKDNFDEKIVIDTTNPLDFSQGIPPKFSASPGNSLGQQIQNSIPRAKVVKAFNAIGANLMVNPLREEGSPDLFIAGNNDEAKKIVSALARKFGWESIIDLGDITNSFWLEANAMMWINYAFKNNTWTHAFKLLKK
jgi:predicted dinucleotide-binding enzyme